MAVSDVLEADRLIESVLARIPPSDVLGRQRAEALLASALTWYGGALLRIRELVPGFDPLIAREPLGGVLALHRCDSPSPPKVDETTVQQASIAMDRMLDEVIDDPDPSATAAADALALLCAVHGYALAQLVESVGAELVGQLAADPLVSGVLLLHDLHPTDGASSAFIPVGSVTVRRSPGDRR